ncbi:peptide MFS transporter [Owenweeksia hongkongensis]|uniref:peptide MFS transporter n=1 Tax=Owenweeksia hongkongensis TaxID=253245 RepID=UPI003A93E316
MEAQESTSAPEMLGHPKGLFYLFFAELWERFSFYGMKALLVLYMIKQLLFTDEMSFGVFAAYMSLVYVTPLIGGMLADKFLGFRKAIIIGGVFMTLGHLLLTIEMPVFFYGSLALIIVGNGFFKPNISTFVGSLYHKNDPRRDSGFTIFYMGINIGGALAPLLCALVAEMYGWHYGFILAGLGMITGLLVFYRGIKSGVFGNHGLPPSQEIYNQKVAGLNRGNLIALLSFLSVPLFALGIYLHHYEHFIVWLAAFLIVGVLVQIYLKSDKVEKGRLIVIGYLTMLMTLFWAVFEQAGSSLTLFADRNVNLIWLSAAQTNSINSLFIIALAIPFSALWAYLTRINRNPNSAIKSGMGLLFLGIGFLLFALSARDVDSLARTPMFYLFAGYFILTIGELFVSPIGLSKMTELSPTKYVSFVMGVFFSSSFFGHFFAGKIASLTALKKGEVNIFSEGFFGKITAWVTGLDYIQITTANVPGLEQLYSYVSVYAGFGVLMVLLGLLAIVISPIIKKLMGGIN